MLPSSDDLVRFVERHPGLKTRDLARELKVADEEFDDFVSLSLYVQRTGGILRVPLGGWDIPERTDYRVGRLDVARGGQGFVRVAPGTIHEEDFFIRPESLGSAFPGDFVLMKVSSRLAFKGERGPKGRREPKGRGGARGFLREGIVADVIERGRGLIRGRLTLGRKGGSVEPFSRHISREIHVPESELGAASDGEEVLVRLTSLGPGSHPTGKVVVRRDEEGTFQSDLKVIHELFNLPGPHSPQALKEAECLEDVPEGKRLPGRVDLRDQMILTIDPADAKDFDDAISLEPLGGGNVRLGVHIADVSHYVKHGSALDSEAEIRGTSIYLPGQVIPMLPERISNGLCSLRPHEDRLAITVQLTLDSSAEPKSCEIFRSVIRSHRRFTYEEVLAILQKVETGKASPSLPSDHAEYEKVLEAMARLRDKLQRMRYERGALYLDIPKLTLRLDGAGRVTSLAADQRDPSHSLIEEFMLAANEAVATYLVERGLPLVARVHAPPQEKKMEDLRTFLGALGWRVGTRGGSEELQRLVAEVSDDPLSPIVQLALLRSMEHAEYQFGPGLHFALAATHYCHFTSPIRRYPDLLVHQILDEHFSGLLDSPGRRARWAQRLPRAAEMASELERRAEEAEREMIRLRLIRYLQPLVGQEMQGCIVSVHPFGFFVRVDDTLVEGMVPVGTLADDYYEFDKEKMLLHGRRGRRKFKLGDRVRVQLAKADPDLREITFHVLQSKVGEGDEREATHRRRLPRVKSKQAKKKR